MTVRVLLVCMGNICRSPLAEGILRHHAARLGKAVATDSAGTYGGHRGDPPDSRARKVAKAHGISIDDLRARTIRAEDFHEFDHILVADDVNHAAVSALAPSKARAQIAYMLDRHPGVQSGRVPRELPDPYYGDLRDFEHVHALLDEALAAWLEAL
ncbi:MAG: low molecular weight protein-tyrosine-phosphatase [Cardiobacteriaceae bacterium]|nr:low molecular weight protein-tyrosine-phosphatase [Cardiobacteriaceae bacterium]